MNSLEQAIASLTESRSDLARRAVAEYTPIVDSILRDQSQDIRRIERTLDGLLDFCFDPEALLHYKRLCRHYFAIDAAAAETYVQAYRDMWDSDPPNGHRSATEGGPSRGPGGCASGDHQTPGSSQDDPANPPPDR